PPARDTGSVEHHVDATVVAHDRVDGLTDRRLVGDVGDAHVTVGTGLQVDADDLRALVTEPAGARQTDPRRGARHPRNLAVETTPTIPPGCGVRMLPKPYTRPIRSAESAAVIDLLIDGRVEFGTGRSSTRAEIEGFDIDPQDTRAMWSEALEHIVGAWTNEYYQADGKYWHMGGPRRVQPKPLQKPHPPLWGATSSADGHREIGRHGIGLCSFTVGVPPEDLVERIAMYREGLDECEKPVGKEVNDRAATFTMVHCADTNEQAFADAEESFPWYIKTAVRHIGSLVDWQAGKDLGTYSYAEHMAQ